MAKKKQITILGMSDLHGFLPDPVIDMDLPGKKPFDLLLIAGDILPLEIQKNYLMSHDWINIDFMNWAQSLVDMGIVRKVIYIPGNHDFIFDVEYTEHEVYNTKHPRRIHSKKDVILLIDDVYIYKGWKIYGSPWCPNLKNWAFYGSSEKLYMQFGLIPDDTDILITHCPPSYQNFGRIMKPSDWSRPNSYMLDVGSKELYECVQQKPNIKLHVFGHIHSGDHNPDKNINGTTFANISIKDENYNPTYNPLIITLKA